jgi:hypothetical protein
MVRRDGRYVIRRDNNVLEVDFSREPDPPAPRFPGASGLRRVNQEGGEPGWSSPLIWSSGAGGRPHGGRKFNDFHVA